MNDVVHLIYGPLANAGKPWSDQDDADLLALDEDRFPLDVVVLTLGRIPEEIAARIEQLKPKAASASP